MNLRQTREWCASAHRSRNQRYGNRAYSFHLRRTEGVALRFGIRDSVIRKACWGHDVPEDLGTTEEELLAAGFEPASVVLIMAVTDEPGATRKERKLKTYPKIRRTWRAIIVKLCDRIANVEYSIETGNTRKLETYRSEQAVFEEHCRDRDFAEAEPLWQHLNRLFADNPPA